MFGQRANLPFSLGALTVVAGAVGLVLTSTGPAESLQTEGKIIGDPGATGDPDLKAVEDHIEIFVAGDLDAFVTTFAEDATVIAYGMTATGHEEIRRLYELSMFPDVPGIEIVSSHLVEGTVVLRIKYDFPAEGEVCCSVAEYTVRDGKIAHLLIDG